MTQEEWFERYDAWFDAMAVLVNEYLDATGNRPDRLQGEIEEMLYVRANPRPKRLVLRVRRRSA